MDSLTLLHNHSCGQSILTGFAKGLGLEIDLSSQGNCSGEMVFLWERETEKMNRHERAKKAEGIQKRFIRQYVEKELYQCYVKGCGLSTVGLKESEAAPTEKENLCIVVLLARPLPRKLKLPQR